MSSKRVLQFPAGALSLAAIVSLLAACAPAKRIPFSDIGVVKASPSLTIKKDIDMVRLEGTLPSFEQVDRVYQQAAKLFDAATLINDIIIDESVADAEWLGPVLATVEGVSHIEDFSVMAANGQMLVGGSVATEAGADSIESMASDFAGLDLAVTSNLQVPEGDYQDIDLSVALENEPVVVMPATLVEQPAVAVARPDISEVATAVRVIPEAVGIAPDNTVTKSAASNDVPNVVLEAEDKVDADPVAVIDVTTDTDADGIPDIDDQCISRAGYPVSNNGCQLLDGYLNDLQFTDQATALADGTAHELDEIAVVMREYPEARIAVISYAEGETGIQRAVARKRAFLVTSYLQGLGIDKQRVKTFALPNQPGAADRIMIREVD